MRLSTQLSFAVFFPLIIFLLASSPAVAQNDSTIFRDDFNRSALGSTWLADPSWSVKNGSAYNFIDGTSGILTTAKQYSQASYIIETYAKGFTDNYHREFRITFGQADASTDKLYQLMYTGYNGGRLVLSLSTDNIYNAKVLDEAAVYPALSPAKWYKFKIARYQSGLIQVYIDKGSGYSSTPLLEATDMTFKSLGHTGWHVGTEAYAEDFFVDWFSIKKPGKEKGASPQKPAEDNLITQITAQSGKDYKVMKLMPGIQQFTDRNYTIKSIPEYLRGASFIQSANDDKGSKADTAVTFFLKEAVVLYVAYDPRASTIPGFLDGFTLTGDRITTTDNVGYLNIYSKLVSSPRFVPVALGGNLSSPAAGAATNYLIAAIQQPGSQQLQAEDALLSGVKVASNNLNYNGTGFADFINASNDYIEWTFKTQIPGTYNIGFRFANAGAYTRTLNVTSDGSFAGTVSFPNVSSSWSTWAFQSGPNIYFLAGTHKLRITAAGTSGPNIDELNLSLTSLSSPGAIPYALAANKSIYFNAAATNGRAYPNPFTATTTIYFTTIKKSVINLKIYSTSGQLIQSLLAGEYQAGSYSAVFTAGKLPKGTYMYRLQIDKEVKTGELIKE